MEIKSLVWEKEGTFPVPRVAIINLFENCQLRFLVNNISTGLKLFVSVNGADTHSFLVTDVQEGMSKAEKIYIDYCEHILKKILDDEVFYINKQAQHILEEINLIKQVAEKGIPENEQEVHEFNNVITKIAILSEKIAGKPTSTNHGGIQYGGARTTEEYHRIYKSPLSKSIQVECSILKKLFDDLDADGNNKIALLSTSSNLESIINHISHYRKVFKYD